MPLPGGPSDKAGNRYEYLWTVMCMIRVMRGEASSIHLEPPGHEGEGIEFSVTTSSGTEYHQAKRQLTGKGVWSLNQLHSRGVLSHFYQRLGDPSASCVFTSAHAAHPLDELALRAQDASSWAEFEQTFISSLYWSNNFDLLHDLWSSHTKEDSYQRLRRIRIVTEDEDSLRTSVEHALEILITGNPSNALSALLDFASNQIHQELAPSDIWGFLKSRGLTQQTWEQDQIVGDAISELNRTYRSRLDTLGIGGEIVPRKEVNQILSNFEDDEAGNIVLVTGSAGVGKTSVISQTLAAIESRELPMLALRVDQMDPSSATPAALGESLGLPASPISVLAAVAKGQDCLLVIDQMDAVSLASGRNPDFFNCISAMLHQAQRYPNMKVLSACRKFDVENDDRLRQLIEDGGLATEIRVEQFDGDTVRSVVAKLGLDAGKLSPKQIDLLSLPIHLKLLSEIMLKSGVASMDFQTAKDLYDRFWDYKRMAMRSRIDGTQTQSVMNLVIESMTKRQALFVPVALLDQYDETVSVIVSENILVKDGPRYSFFHEGFFDYIFARWFLSAGFDLVSYILERGQDLFMRSQIRQILLHERDISTQDFSRKLEAILANDNIRIHLKTNVLSLLGSLHDPTAEEWDVVERLLNSDLSNHVWGALLGSATWFDLLDGIGTIQQWLESGDEQLESRTLWLLSPLQRERPNRIAELLCPFVGSSEIWNRRLADLFVRSNAGASRGFLDFAIKLVNTGVLDDLLHPTNQSESFWYPIRGVVETEPDWTCEVVAAYFERLLDLAKQSGTANPFPSQFNSHRTGRDVITKAAKATPKTFIELLLPFLTVVIERNADKSYGPPWRDGVWGHGSFGVTEGLGNHLLATMESAMCWLAVNEPDEFRMYASKFRESDYHTIQNLLVRSYAAGGKRFADEAVEYLLEDAEKRFEIDYVSTSSKHAIQQLLSDVTPYCSPDHLITLEQAILEYYPLWERGADGRKGRGAFQLGLLESIEAARLSEKALHRLQELQRKFGGMRLYERRGMEGGLVSSPIPESSARKMNDGEWIGAINRYSSNSPSRDPGKLLSGGAYQLSQLLEAQSKEDPKRFANLIHRIPDDANPAYFEAVLKGITGSDIDMETVVAGCLRCHRIPGRPLGRWITQPLAHVQDSLLPDEALEMIAWYATEDPEPDPIQVSSNRTYYQSGQEILSYEPVFVGINSVRGAAATSIAKLIFQDEHYFCFFKRFLNTMVNDPADATRACVVEALLGVLRHDRNYAVKLFLDLSNTNKKAGYVGFLPKWLRKRVIWLGGIFKRPVCTNKRNPDERLLAIEYVEMFLKYATQTHFGQLEALLAHMVKSDIEEVSTTGARWVCYASLTVEEALPLANRCTSGTKSLRLGAADVYSSNIKMSAHRSVCEEILAKLFSDSEAEVRRAASRCFYEFEGRELQDYQGLAKAFIHSEAFNLEHDPLFDALEKTTANLPDVVLMACERILEVAGQDTGDIRTAVAGTSSSMAKLIVRVYGRTTDPSLKSRCLDIIDKMSLFGSYGLDAITDEFDR